MGASQSPSVHDLTKVEKKSYLQLETTYELQRTIGKGGSCCVMEAVACTNPNKRLAVKVLPKKKAVYRELFKREVAVLSELNHPHIIKLKASAENESSCYVVTEMCSGGDLLERINQDPKLTERAASELMRDMLSALKYCHDRNLVHRDLKPDNFVFDHKNADAKVKLIDFGFAHQVEEEKEYCDFGGTLSYFAPELAATHMGFPCKGKVLKAADVWAMGIIAYAMLTRRMPFSGHSKVQLFLSIVRDPVSFPTDVELSDSFKDFVDLLLTKNALRRPTVDEALNHPWITGDTSGDLNCKENEDDEDDAETDVEGEHDDSVPPISNVNAEPGEQVEGVLGSDAADLESKSTDPVKASSTTPPLRNASLHVERAQHQTMGGSNRCCSKIVDMMRKLRRSDSNGSYDSASLTPEFASEILREENRCPNWRALAQSCNCLRRNMST